MAAGICRLFGSELGLATTGYAEPSAAAPQPFAYWALAHVSGGKTTLRSGRIDCPGATRVQVQEKVAAAVVAELVRYLRS
jgi:nicotinamide-nucleotide amidase